MSNKELTAKLNWRYRVLYEFLACTDNEICGMSTNKVVTREVSEANILYLGMDVYGLERDMNASRRT